MGLTAERQFGFHAMKRALRTHKEVIENLDDAIRPARDLESRSRRLIDAFDPMTYRAIPEYQR